jgi:hypothetical protein
LTTNEKIKNTSYLNIAYNEWIQKCDDHRFILRLDETNKRFETKIGNLKFLQPAGDWKEEYSKLTDKVFHMLKDAYQYNNKFDWYLKADDDTFVFMNNLRKFLSNKNSSSPIDFGYDLKIFGKTSKFHKGTDWFKFGYYKIRDAINALDSCFFNNSNSESNSKQFKPNSIDINLSHIEQITHEKGAIRHQMKVMLLLLLYCCMNSIYKQLNENLKYYLKKSLDNSLSKKDRFTYTKLAIIQFLSDYNAIALHSNNEQNLLKYADNQTVTDLVNLLLVKLSSDHYLNETNIHALEQRKTMLEKINQNMIDKQNLDLQISELQNTIANLRKSK